MLNCNKFMHALQCYVLSLKSCKIHTLKCMISVNGAHYIIRHRCIFFVSLGDRHSNGCVCVCVCDVHMCLICTQFTSVWLGSAAQKSAHGMHFLPSLVDYTT